MLKMKRSTSLVCIAVCLSLLCFSLIHCFSYKHSKRRHDSHTQIHQKRHSMKKLCEPSLNYQTAGAIIQQNKKCSPGFYKEWAGSHMGQCVPCSCNGLLQECDEQTGHCVNCQFNTTGNHCERCKEGYYGNAAIRTCRACPCPFTQNNFASACLEISLEVVECLCKRGYSSARCERCSFGYYGNPMMQGGICKPCNCTDRSLNICDPLTGECIRCDNTSCNGNCQELNTCAYMLLVDLDKMDGGLTWTEQQYIADGLATFKLNHLQANALETKIKVGRQSAAVRHTAGGRCCCCQK
ncbi:laminin subunit alpha-3-like [Melanotaenia boesemani]|uniref:laminin subunit alpha-3-like n=1 Tax=Melanotaenia boesemani TaxID=1250792 RepID=UPI001C04E35B|nr:laminin subunit alpha-3-like [Melanotaenia boesemani]